MTFLYIEKSVLEFFIDFDESIHFIQMLFSDILEPIYVIKHGLN